MNGMTWVAAAAEPNAVNDKALERWMLCAAAFVIPLAVLPNTFDRYVLPKLLLARVTVILLAALYLVRCSQAGRLSWMRTLLDLPLLAFLGSAILSTIFAVNQNVALFGTYFRYEGFFTLLTYGGLFWFAVQLMSPRDAVAVSRSLLAAGYVVAVIAIWQSMSGGLTGALVPCGIVRPYATFGNAVFMSAFLAMLLPLAISEFITAPAWPSRLLAFNLLLAMSLALLLGFTRSAWIGAALGTVLVLAGHRSLLRARPGLSVGLAGLIAVGALLAVAPAGGWSMGRCTAARVVSIAHPTLGSAAVRPHIWGDTLALAASRPLLGYGPDSFGLVYPRFESGDWIPGQLIDKAHSDILQVAATQGGLGVLTYLWLAIAFVVAVWRGRTMAGWGMLGGWVAYQVTMQANFSWVPAAAPFWLFAAVAISMTRSATTTRVATPVHRPLRPWPGAAIALAASCLLGLAVVGPYVADTRFMDSVRAIGSGDRPTARIAVAEARARSPHESLYAVAAGHLAMDLRADGRPGPGADWAAARDDFQAAIRLGTADPTGWRGLAVAERELGHRGLAVALARQALDLDRFDRASQTLLDALARSAKEGS